MLSNVLKSVSIRTYRLFIMEGVEHVFIETQQGALVHIMPHLNISRVVHHMEDFNSENRYYASYSITEKAFYFQIFGSELIEYYPLTGEKNVYQPFEKGGWQSFRQFANYIQTDIPNYQMTISTDGHIYMSASLIHGLYGYVRFNTATKEFDEEAIMPDQEFAHIHGRQDAYAFSIANNVDFEGAYTSYLFSDDYVHLRSTILSEIAASGLNFVNDCEFLLHYDDRAVSSLKRRIYTKIIGVNRTWKIIDIKDPSKYIDTQVFQPMIGIDLIAPNSYPCIDELGNTVIKTGWTSKTNLSDVAATWAIPMPTFNSSIAYSYPFKIGRYVYIGENRMASNLFYNFAIHPITKEAIYPSSFDKWSTFLNNPGYSVYKCNFGGAFGFSSDDELVVFLRNGSGNLGFIRPDTHVWYEYNPVTDSSGYVIRIVNLYSITDPDGFGIRWGGSVFSELAEATIGGENCLVDAVGKSAVVEEYDQSVTGRLADVTFFVYPQKTRPSVRFEFEIPDLVVQTATISQAINTRDNLLVCVGRVYTGTTVIDQTAPTAFTLRKYIGGTGSPNGAWRIDNNRVFIAVYMAKQYIIDATAPDNATKVSLVGGDVTEALYATVRTDGVIFSGVTIRTASYQSGFRLTHINLSTYAVTGITNKFPTEFNGVSSATYRNLVGLPSSDYSDAAVEAAVQARMTAASLTRAQVIAEFVDSCRWSNSDMHSWGNYTVFGLSYVGRRKLANIRIEQTVGSGVWIDANYQTATYPKALLVNTSDILNLSSGEITAVEIQVAGGNYIGRVAGTSTHLFWVQNDFPNSQGIIRIISKSAFLAAGTTLSAFDSTVYVAFGTGGGFGDGTNFDSSATQQINCMADYDGKLYITMRSSTNTNAIIRVDSSGTIEVVATGANAVRTISINAGKLVVTNGTTVTTYNLITETLPITL